MVKKRKENSPSKPVEDFNRTGVMFLGPSKTAEGKDIKQSEAIHLIKPMHQPVIEHQVQRPMASGRESKSINRHMNNGIQCSTAYPTLW